MRYGHTTIIHLGSRIISTVLGFVATVVIARILGASVLGTYFVVIAVVLWIKIITAGGIESALKKRVSEIGESDSFLSAAAILQGSILLAVSGAIVFFRSTIKEYIGASIVLPLLGLLITQVLFSLVIAVLQGQDDVHLAAILDPVERSFRSVLQVGVAVAGFALLGLVLGFAVATLIASAMGAYFVTAKFQRPNREHFTSLLSYARYSWIGRISSRGFASMDTLMLGLFVPSHLIGVYEIAWNVASILAIFGNSVSQTLFPDISQTSSKGNLSDVGEYINISLSYAGLFLLPGLAGGMVLGDRVLAVYGTSFVKGANVLIILIIARLIFIYEKQFTSILNAINHPEAAFRVNVVFLSANILLNFVLIATYGWIGAAVATTVSALLGLLVGYHMLQQHVQFKVPYRDFAKQSLAAMIMAGIVAMGRGLLGGNLFVVLTLIAVGAVIYFGILYFISYRFRTSVQDNLSTIL